MANESWSLAGTCSRTCVVTSFFSGTGGTIRRKAVVQDYVLRNWRLHTYRFPAYARELNPDEHVWTQAKRTLANREPYTIDELKCGVGSELFRLRHSPNLLWSVLTSPSCRGLRMAGSSNI